MINASLAFIAAMKSPVKQLSIKLEIFDSQMKFIKEITKSVTKDDIGSVSVSRDRAIRRSFSFSLLNNNNEFDFGENNLIFLDKRVKLFLGLKLPSGDIEYVPQGVFIVTEPSDSHLESGKKANITGQDKAYLLTDRRGVFATQTTIATGTNISVAIKTIASAAGETMFNFDSVVEVTPYELTYASNDSRWKALEELSKLCKSELYYDVNGYLTLKRIDLNAINQYASVWTYDYTDPNERFYAGNVRKLDDGILANHIIVLGGSSSTAETRYELVVTNSDPNWSTSPYSVERLGRIIYFHNNGSPDPLLGGTTNDACKFRAKWELMKRLGYSERMSLNISPNFLHDAGDIIEINDPENSVSGKYLLQSFSLPINPQIMTCECWKQRIVISDWNFI